MLTDFLLVKFHPKLTVSFGNYLTSPINRYLIHNNGTGRNYVKLLILK